MQKPPKTLKKILKPRRPQLSANIEYANMNVKLKIISTLRCKILKPSSIFLQERLNRKTYWNLIKICMSGKSILNRNLKSNPSLWRTLPHSPYLLLFCWGNIRKKLNTLENFKFFFFSIPISLLWQPVTKDGNVKETFEFFRKRYLVTEEFE